MGAGTKRSPRRMLALERETKALEMRTAGAPFQLIADELGMSNSGVQHIMIRVHDKLVAHTIDQAEHMRAIENARLDKMLYGIWSRAKSGDEKAITAALGILDRRRKLYGLDAPTLIDARVDVVEGSAMIVTADQLERLSEQELLTYRALSTKLIGPPSVIEGELVEGGDDDQTD